MASIISSTFTVQHAQRDGRVYVRESHDWDDGSITDLEYGPVGSKSDFQGIADARALVLMDTAAVAEQVKAERAAIEEKISTVIDAAVKGGALTEEEAKKAGLPVSKEATIEAKR